MFVRGFGTLITSSKSFAEYQPVLNIDLLFCNNASLTPDLLELCGTMVVSLDL